MAKNYTFSEAVAIVAAGKDMEAIQDLGRRYPILVQKVGVVATKAGAEFVELMSFMPEYLTANKVNTGIKNAVFGGEKEADESGEDTDETSENPYENKSAMDLFKECKKRGIKAAPKKPAKFYADLLIKADASTDDASTDDADKAEAESDDWDEEEAPKEEKKAPGVS